MNEKDELDILWLTGMYETIYFAGSKYPWIDHAITVRVAFILNGMLDLQE